MSTQVANSPPFRAYLGNEDLLRERQNANSRMKQTKDRTRKVAIESSHTKYFTDGVRAPLLSDINFGQSCRLDVVRPIKHVQATGSSSPESPGRKTGIPQIPLEKENTTICYSDRTTPTVKSMKFLLPNGTLRSYNETETARSASDLDIRWQRSRSQISDARDVLYRNTYCNQNKKLRYHTMTLPSISSQNKAVPRMSKNRSTTKKKTALKNDEQPQTKMKETEVLETKGNNRKDSTSSNNEVSFLKVQKIKSHVDNLPNGDDIFLNVRQPTDLYSQNSNYPIELRTERPLKYETVGPHGSRLHRKHSTLRNLLPYSVRDYKSAEAYKEYLEAVKSKMELGSDSNKKLDNDWKNSYFGRDNRMLQSVMDANMPSNDRHGPLSHDSKSLVIEIKPTWNEVPNGLNDDNESDIDLGLSACPVNTPAHD